MVEELKSCPFCGDNSAHFTYVELPEPHGVRCPRCRASIGEHDSKRDAAIHWNTRSPAWRSIESAPSDISWVLLWNGQEVCVGYYTDDPHEQGWVNGLYAEHCQNVDDYQPQPTHWMPLPLPPEEEA